MTSQIPRRAHTFQALEVDECTRLLGCMLVGRVAFADDDGIVVYPVNHVLHDGALYFRTSPHARIVSRLQRDRQISFQVDEVDEFLRAGWSVLVRGHAELVDADEVADVLPSIDHPEPWAGGARTVTVRITPVHVSGRRVLPA